MSRILLGHHKEQEVHLDLAALAHGRLLVQGGSGAGKSWALRRILEQSFGQVQQIVVDIEGEWASLAEVYGHLVVEVDEVRRVGPRRLAAAARENRISLVVDLSDATRGEQVDLASGFVEGLIDVDEAHWHPVLVAIDEVHQLAPQGAAAGIDDDARKQGVAAVTDLMARGRKRGLIPCITTQRLAKLAKSVVSEVSNLVIGRNTLDIDVARAIAMLGVKKADGERVLRNLKPGSFIALGPAFSPQAGAVTVRIGPVESDHRGKAPTLSMPPVVSADQAGAMLAALPDARPPAPVAAGAPTPRRRENAWTDDELAILRQSYDAKLSRRDIAARLPGRTVSAIGYKAGELGLLMAPSAWTAEEKDTLRRLIEDGVHPDEVAEIMGRPRGGVNTMMCALGLHVRKPWTAAEYDLVRQRHAEGGRMVDVARELGRNYAAVAKIVEKMGLAFRPSTQTARTARANKPVRVSAEQLLELVRERHGEPTRTPKGWIVGSHSYTPEQLVALVNRHRTASGEAPVTMTTAAA